MDFKDLVLYRQSDRKYDENKIVEKEKINQCIEASRLAPSACNSQPWTFVVADDKIVVEQLSKAAANLGMNTFAKHCPVIIAIVMEKANFTAKIGGVMKDKDFPLIDIGFSASYFCLQAADLGLGTCVLGWFDEKKVKKILNIDDKKRVPLLITLGYSLAKTRQKIRKDNNKMCKYNRYK